MRPLLAMMLLFGSALPVRAELVYFASGRTMSVRSHSTDGALVVLSLRSGGEMTCELSLIDRITPDEVPYPELPAAQTAVLPAPPVVPRLHAALPTDARYDGIIKDRSAKHGVDPELVRAVIQVESAYQARARSTRGAVGLMQVLPSTARQYGVRNLYDPSSNIDVGIRHLKTLLDRFPLTLALAAYNAGQAAVERFRGVPPYRETEDYVARILALVGT